ncbi:nuclease-related domain-containing protein [Alkalibacillus silvisoli]|uniref:nuclease-related domain-containing protein n=1 Tax=Alkalibacillus silvisoli TaxID=392823 RepID=UPI0031D8C664
MKQHEIPAKLIKLLAARRRLYERHVDFNRIETDLYREQSGYAGELRVDYPLSKLDFPHFILHDLRLRLFKNYFQMDTFILTDRFALILEVKNLAGIITYNPTYNQLIQTVDGDTHTYDDPLIQVEEQKQQLKQWLSFLNAPKLPIETLVVMANSKGILDISSEKHRQQVIPISLLTQKIREISSKYSQAVMSVDRASRLAHTLKERHVFKDFNVMQNYRVTTNDYIRGVFCPNCGALPMIRTRCRWQCRRCQIRSTDAHVHGFRDFYLLVGSEITNKELRSFFRINSSSLSKYLLKQQNFESIGKTNMRKYILDFNYHTSFDYLFK